MKNTTQHLLLCVLAFLAIFGHPLLASDFKCEGRVDVGPVFVHLDVLEFGKTVRRLDLGGVRLDSTLAIYKGFCIKPTFTYASNNGTLYNAGLALGHFLPVNESLCLTPYVGYSYTYVKATFSAFNPLIMQKLYFTTSFNAYAPMIGIDAHWKFWECWRLCGSLQYAWSHSLNHIKHVHKYKSHSSGPSMALFLERDLGKHWSVNVAGAFNYSLTRRKHGLRIYGFKLGIARWF